MAVRRITAARSKKREKQMANYMMLVTSSAKDGRDEEYNTWYDNQHIHDVCATPGIGEGQRWDAIPEVSPNSPPTAYIATYEITADNPQDALAEMMRRAEAGQMPMTDAIDLESAQIWVYKKH